MHCSAVSTRLVPLDPTRGWRNARVRAAVGAERCQRCTRWEPNPNRRYGICPHVRGSTACDQTCDRFDREGPN